MSFSRSLLSVLFTSCLVLITSALSAHEVRPAYLELRETDEEVYNVLWKVPGRGENLRLGLYVEFPADTEVLSEPVVTVANNSMIERWVVGRVGGLDGEAISISGLRSTMTDVLVRIEHNSGRSQVVRLAPSSPSFVVEASPGAVSVATTYLHLGIEHIIGGIDHLLFVLGLLLLVGREWKPLIATITAFTVAHSITLGFASLGFVSLPQAPVEAVIALSIVFVASEYLHARAGRKQLVARSPWIVSFVFGLLHGFGFAGALTEIGLPYEAIPLSLLFFNLGVELGQIAFVAVVLLVIKVACWIHKEWPQWIELISPYAIGSIAAFWTIERTLSIFVS